MKEHYVSYECAQALKRLGFKEETTHYYINFQSDGEVKLWSCNPPDNHNARLSTNEVCSAPRLDQAAAWIRDKGIHISVNPKQECFYENRCLVDTKHFWNFDLVQIKDEWTPYGSLVEYESYESALSAGISAAIELLGKEVKE